MTSTMLAPPRRFVAVERVLKDNWKAGQMTFVLPGGRKVVFSGAEGELRFAGHLLQGDVNGDGVADFEVKVLGALVGGDIVL